MAMITYATLAKSLGLTLKSSAASTPMSTASRPHSEPSPRNIDINASQLQWGFSAPIPILSIQEDPHQTERAVDQPLISSSISNFSSADFSITPSWTGTVKRQHNLQAFDTLEEGELMDIDTGPKLQPRSQFEVPRVQALADKDSNIASSRPSTPPALSCKSNPSLFLPLNSYAAAPSSALTAGPASESKTKKVGPPRFSCSSRPSSGESMAKLRGRDNADTHGITPGRQDVCSPLPQSTFSPANVVTPDTVGQIGRGHNNNALRPGLDVESHGGNSRQIECRSLTDEQLHHAKVLVLDLLGWGVTPEYLLQRGISLALLYTVFTDLQLRLPEGIVADCVALVAARSRSGAHPETRT